MEDNVAQWSGKSRLAAIAGALVLALAIAAGIYWFVMRPAEAKTFPTPEEGVSALVNAARKHDFKTLEAVLGPESQDIIESGDAVADRAAMDRFVTAYDMKSSLVPNNPMSTSLHVGDDDWALPIPLVMQDGRWRFDANAGSDEIISRRIGRNETNAMEASLAYVDAQREYASIDHSGDGVLKFAQRFVSTKGKKDGLYWPVQGDEPPSPLGAYFAEASAENYLVEAENAAKNADNGTQVESQPFYGYYYRILTSQGPDAPGGAYDYIANGDMIGGFAMIAYPDEYGVSGVMTFMVNHDGVVYQKDLGPDSASIAEGMKTFNPDNTWEKVQK
jgi:hypothetical protein